MKQEFAWAPRLMAEAIGSGIFRDMGIEEIELATGLACVGLSEGSSAIAQRLDLGALQQKPGLQPLFNKVIVCRPAVPGDDLAPLRHGSGPRYSVETNSGRV